MSKTHNKEFNLQVELSTRTEPIEIEVTLNYTWANSGIGAYEFWGAVGFDRGVDYAEIEGWSYDQTGFTNEELKEIEDAIEAASEKWAESIEPEDNNCED